MRIEDVFSNTLTYQDYELTVGNTTLTKTADTSVAGKVSFMLDKADLVAGETVTLKLTFGVVSNAKGTINNKASLHLRPRKIRIRRTNRAHQNWR
jgi:hypothetical protein